MAGSVDQAQRLPLSLTQESYADRLRGINQKPANVTLALAIGATPLAAVERDLARLARAEPQLQATLSPAAPAGLRIGHRRRARIEATSDVEPEAVPDVLYRDSQHLFAEGEPLWRAHLLRAADGSGVLSLVFHHIIFDGVSRGIFLRSLAGPGTAPVPGRRTYDEFTRWQRETFEGDVRHAGFWRGYLGGWAHNRHVNLGFARNLDQPLDDACAQLSVSLTGASLWKSVQWGRPRHASLFVQVLSALSVALGEATGEPENLVRATFHGRPPGFEETLGCFGHDVVVRLATKPVGLDQALRTTQEAWEALGEYMFTPYRLVRRAAGGSALPFRPVIVTLNSLSATSRTIAFGRELTVLEVPERLPEEGLHIQLSRTASALTMECTYHPVRFAAGDVRAFLGRIMAVLREPLR